MKKTSGYSGKPLYQKLGMKPGTHWMLVNQPAHYFDILGAVNEVSFNQKTEELDGIHVFTKTAKEVEEHFQAFKGTIKKNGMIWFSWYKKSAKIPTDVSEDVIRDTALSLGLVDVKVCAVDAQWSALKIVWRKKNR